MSILTDAGVDMLVLDVTNAVRYWEEWEVLLLQVLEEIVYALNVGINKSTKEGYHAQA
jgi:hypothetical protein